MNDMIKLMMMTETAVAIDTTRSNFRFFSSTVLPLSISCGSKFNGHKIQLLPISLNSRRNYSHPMEQRRCCFAA